MSTSKKTACERTLADTLVSIQLPPEIAADFDRIARKRKVTRDEIIREAIRAYWFRITVAEYSAAWFKKPAKRPAKK